jgi:hypothetical protein
MVVGLLLSAVAPRSASAEWVQVYKGMPDGPHYAWKNPTTGVIEITRTLVSGEGWKETVRATAAAEVQVGATGQSSLKMYGTKAADAGESLITRMKSAGTAVKGAMLSQTAESKLLPALSTLGKFSNVASAGYLGWQIGSEIRDLFMDSKPPNKVAGPVAMVGQEFVAPGATVITSSGPTSTAVATMAPGGTCAIFKELEETVGTASCSGMTKRESMPGKTCPSATDWRVSGSSGPVIAPERGVLKEGTGLNVNSPTEGCQIRVGYYYVPILAASLGVGDGFPGTTSKTGTAPAAVGGEDLEKAVESELQNPIYDPANAVGAQTRVGGVGKIGPNGELEVVVPEIKPGVKIKKYEEELEETSLQPHGVPLPDYAINPNYGPEEVTKTVPAPGTTVAPGSVVKVRYNPETAPEVGEEVEGGPGGAPGGWTPPVIPEIDLTPLTSTGLGCNTFPFGLPCYLYDVIDSINVTPECPQFEVPLYGGNEMDIDTCVLDPVLSIWRPVFLAIASIGIVIMFAGLAGMGRTDDD